MSPQELDIVLRRMNEAGSLEFTKDFIQDMYVELEKELCQVEEKMGKENPILRKILENLRI